MMTKIAAGSVVYGKRHQRAAVCYRRHFRSVTAVMCPVSQSRKGLLRRRSLQSTFRSSAETHEKEEKDFFNMRKLGVGGFGEVSAMKKLDTGKLYAVKAMSKKRSKKSEALRWNERYALGGKLSVRRG